MLSGQCPLEWSCGSGRRVKNNRYLPAPTAKREEGRCNVNLGQNWRLLYIFSTAVSRSRGACISSLPGESILGRSTISWPWHQATGRPLTILLLIPKQAVVIIAQKPCCHPSPLSSAYPPSSASHSSPSALRQRVPAFVGGNTVPRTTCSAHGRTWLSMKPLH